MKTIAGQINWDFKTNGDLDIRDKNGNRIYWEVSDGHWSKREYDSKVNLIYWVNSGGFWVKKEYNSRGNQIYFENSNGLIRDNRPKPCEDKVIEMDGKKYKFVRVSQKGFLEKTKNKTTGSRNIFPKLYKCITKLFTHSDKY
jgi:hypothetical protein